jgi:hypothetical protein
MEKGIVSFRPNQEVREKLDRLRKEGAVLSKWINEQIMRGVSSEEVGAAEQCTWRFRFVPEHLKAAFAMADDGKGGEGERVDIKKVYLESESVSRLNLRKYKSFKKCLEDEGLCFYSTKVPDFGVVQMVAVNSDEANVEFQKFFRRNAGGGYERTSVPLPLMRYDSRRGVAIICYSEPV